MTPRNETTFTRVEPTVSFPELERDILAFWRETDAFAESVRSRPVDREYVFYDGPPFPTGSPHYGNLLAGVLKDMVPRYWTMRGYRVERRFGWDTHGLPIEMEVEKRLGISGPSEIAAYGIDRFNEACRLEVQANTEAWETLTERVGRWVDFENDYRTMDPDFMETVWWVFRQLWDKGLVYKAFKVLPYSWGAATPLSNFEANLDYRDTEDPSITVRLRLFEGNAVAETGDHLLIWTTTPWTLPGNLAVAVNPENLYVRVMVSGEGYWVASELVDAVLGEGHPITAKAKGEDLIGLRYEPAFPYFAGEGESGAFRVIGSDEVTTDEGTGLVHMAPAYGEADFYALTAAGLDLLVDPIDAKGNFTEDVPDVAGLNIKAADPVLTDLLSASGKLLESKRLVHSYPFCYRTGTPLMYKAIPTWFVAVERFRDEMVAQNDKVHWVPEHVGSRRFGNWLAGARDWAISRNRYWGSCIPVWECDGCGEQVAVGSLDELDGLAGVRPADLHKHVMDEVHWPCRSCGGVMSRVPEVLDCWFESGSMPYGKLHYPFENRERFEATFPAQFIAEGLDQTRGWFYTLMVLSTALFERPAFENCVVNGLILVEDGQKMSKSLKNYPDPSEIFDRYGADALRAFLINSPVLRAEPLRFSTGGVAEVVRTVLLPMWNTYSFFTTYAEADRITMDDLAKAPPVPQRPEMDRWILSVLQSLISEVNIHMEGYYLYNVVPPTLGFIDHLTNWYVRRSRRRFWRSREDGAEAELDKLSAFATLYEVLTTFVHVLAPVLPFVTEHLYQQLVARHRPDVARSVHHRDFPTADLALIDTDLERAMADVREVVRIGRSLRKKEGHRVRQPLSALTVLTRDPELAEAVRAHAEVIADELNVRSVVVSGEQTDLVTLSAKANYRRLGPVLGPRMTEVATAIAALGPHQIELLLEGETIEVSGQEITADDVMVERTPLEGTVVETGPSFACVLDTTLTGELVTEGLAREIVSRVQQMRREFGLDVSDKIVLVWASDDPDVVEAFTGHGDYIAAEVLANEVRRESPTEAGVDIQGRRVWLGLTVTV